MPRSETSAPVHRGHTWPAGRRFDAAVVSVVECSRPMPRVRSQHSFWALDYLFTPGVRTRIGSPHGRWFERDRRTMHIYAPGTLYWEESPAPGRLIHSAWMLIEGRTPGLEGFMDPATGAARFEDPAQRLGPLFQEAARIAQERGSRGEWQVQSIYCRLVDLLAGAKRRSPGAYVLAAPATPSGDDLLVGRVHDFLRTHIRVRFGLDDLARATAVSISTLSHTYPRLTGESPMKTLTRFRIELARDLLLKGHGLKQIADAAGFCNEFHLSKAFKQAEGLSPRHFLQRLAVPGRTSGNRPGGNAYG